MSRPNAAVIELEFLTKQFGNQAQLAAALDNPETLSQLSLHPSQVITHNREVTHPIAQRLYDQGADGILWPSSIEGSCKNASLFEKRILSKLKLNSDIQFLNTKRLIVQKAADWLNIRIS